MPRVDAPSDRSHIARPRSFLLGGLRHAHGDATGSVVRSGPPTQLSTETVRWESDGGTESTAVNRVISLRPSVSATRKQDIVLSIN